MGCGTCGQRYNRLREQNRARVTQRNVQRTARAAREAPSAQQLVEQAESPKEGASEEKKEN